MGSARRASDTGRVLCAAQHRPGRHIQVNTTQQGVSNGQCSLQEAIYSSEFKLNNAVIDRPGHFLHNRMRTRHGQRRHDLLPPGAVFTFDHFWDGDAHNYRADGHADHFLDHHHRGQWRNAAVGSTFCPWQLAFICDRHVNDPGFGTDNRVIPLTLKNVYIKGFHIKGGDGGSGGGGGGLGAGGAIYVDASFISLVENSTF